MEVTDTGAGIPRENLHRIFDPFFTTKATARGTGLGLSVSYGIIKEHAGKIDVRSTPGKGTSFRLEFPAAQESGSCLKARFWSSTTKRKFAKAWSCCSTSEGYAVTLRGNRRSGAGPPGRTAVRPGAAGRQPAGPQRPRTAARNPRSGNPTLPVILITAYGSIDMARAAFKSGAQDYITKPWSNDELLAQVAQAIEGRRLREENVQLKRALKQRYNFPNIIGKSEQMLAVLDLVTQVAPSRSTVLISRRKRHGQGTDRQGDSFGLDARRQGLCAGQHGIDSRRPAGIAALRPREGRVHQRGGLEEGAFRGGRSRHDFLRRNCHDQSGNAGQAAARDSGARVHAPGRHGNDQGGRAHHRRFQRGLAATWCAKGASARICTTA